MHVIKPRHKAWRTFLVCSCILMGIPSLITAQNGASWTIPIALETKTVDIRLTDKGLSEETLIDDSLMTHQVAITNEGSPCWIRIRTTISNSDHDGLPVNSLPPEEQDAYVMGDDGYIYRTIPMMSRDSILWTERLQDPDEFRGSADRDRWVTTVVEAVQQEHMLPDFASSTPWKNINVEIAQYRINTESESMAASADTQKEMYGGTD